MQFFESGEFVLRVFPLQSRGTGNDVIALDHPCFEYGLR